MQKFLYFAFIASFALVLFSCSKKSSSDNNGNNPPVYTDNLKLGTGMNAADSTLTGEGTSFSVNPGIVFFRLECKDDMAGSNVNIQVLVDSSGIFVPKSTFNFTNSHSSGHIFISSFPVKAAGSYRATGILETGNKTIASIDFTMF